MDAPQNAIHVPIITNTPTPKIANREQMQMVCLVPTIFTKAVRLLNITNHEIILIPGQTIRRDSVVGIVTGYRVDEGGGRSSSPGRIKNVLFSTSSRLALGSTQLPIQLVPGLFPRR
jgi:hypothetical protein